MLERPSQPSRPCPDPASWVDRYGDYLFRYALLRLRDRGAAEDMVQDTLLAALRNRDRFAGRSSFRTWLVAILKRKIIDQLGRAKRQRPAADISDKKDLLDKLFDGSGKWRRTPPAWDDPGAALEQSEFWDVFRRCLGKLPAPQGNAFALRELEGMATEAVRKLLRVTASNLGVLLHRARLGLWRCLSLRWFGEERA